MFDQPNSPPLSRIFRNPNANRNDFLRAMTEVRRNQRVTSANPEATCEALEKDERVIGRGTSDGGRRDSRARSGAKDPRHPIGVLISPWHGSSEHRWAT